MLRRPHLFAGLMLVTLSACDRGDRQGQPIVQTAPVQGDSTAAAPASVALQDVVETRADYLIGISFPQSAARYPGLARALQAYADAARAELMRAVAGLRGRKPPVPYDLSLQFSGLVETPEVVAIAADGSSYTGGAHGQPLVERFVWLPARQQMLDAETLFAAGAWQTLSDASREQLLTALSQRLDSDGVEGTERATQLQSGSEMIAAGTAPVAANFSRFEPVMDVSGRILALRFVFPPDQVSPYMEGTRSVRIPARALLPIITPGYRDLFLGGRSPPSRKI